MLDRKNGYADGVHPNASGYVDLGNGLAPYINNYLK
jgi:lysophospholipase L1-like esterase